MEWKQKKCKSITFILIGFKSYCFIYFEISNIIKEGHDISWFSKGVRFKKALRMVYEFYLTILY